MPNDHNHMIETKSIKANALICFIFLLASVGFDESLGFTRVNLVLTKLLSDVRRIVRSNIKLIIPVSRSRDIL